MSITIPKGTGIRIMTMTHPLVSGGAAGVDLAVFQTGGAMLIRTVPQTTAAVLQVANRENASRIIAAANSGWLQMHDMPPTSAVRASEKKNAEQEVLYELWQF